MSLLKMSAHPVILSSIKVQFAMRFNCKQRCISFTGQINNSNVIYLIPDVELGLFAQTFRVCT